MKVDGFGFSSMRFSYWFTLFSSAAVVEHLAKLSWMRAIPESVFSYTPLPCATIPRLIYHVHSELSNIHIFPPTTLLFGSPDRPAVLSETAINLHTASTRAAETLFPPPADTV